MEINKQISEFTGLDIENLWEFIVTGTMGYIPKIIGAVLVLWIGFKIVKIIEKGINKIMEKQKFSPMLKGFITSFSNMLLKIMVILAAAGVLGVQTSSFVAILAAAGFAIGMALSGTLQNFAGGIIILFLKPFRIGHYVEVGGYSGTVKEIGIFNTTLLTPDKKRVIIPNSDISNGSMINYSAEPKRRLDFVVGVSYNDSIDKVKKTLTELYEKEERILHKDGLTLGVSELADNSVNFNFRFYVKSGDYWAVKYEMLENIKKTFDRRSISFPFPQRDVHVYNEK